MSRAKAIQVTTGKSLTISDYQSEQRESVILVASTATLEVKRRKTRSYKTLLLSSAVSPNTDVEPQQVTF